VKMPWNEATGHEIGAAWLESAIAPVGEFGRRVRRAERAFVSGDETRARSAIAAVVRAAQTLTPETIENARRRIGAAPEPEALVTRALAGDVLADDDFFELQRFLDASGGVRAALRELPPGIAGMPEPLEDLERALEPGRMPGGAFLLADAFDPQLRLARDQATLRRAALDTARAALSARVAGELGLEHLREGEFILMREQVERGVPEGLRVVREAPTYLLCELILGPPEIEALAASETAEAAVAECEERLRARLTAFVLEAAARIVAACDALGALDSFLARVRFAQSYEAVEPEVVERGEPLEFEAARYLPLEERLAATERRYEPISLSLARVAVVTGPNMGGKTAALRACGFLAACVARGVPVPACSARVPLFDEIDWIGIGAMEETALLSSFGKELIELRALLERPPRAALVLIDEFARTTSPREGRALLVALLETLRTRGAHAFAATHLGGIAEAAGVDHYAIAGLRSAPARGEALGLDDALALVARAIDHRLTRVSGDGAGSDALALAEMVGLEGDYLTRAKALLEPGNSKR
jgi:DNA mismatch repair protein MutS2